MRKRNKPSLANVMDGLKADYLAAKSSRVKPQIQGLSAMGSGADYHYRHERDYLKLTELARHYYREDPVVGQAARRLVANILRDGFTLEPMTGSDAVNDRIRERWAMWTLNPDLCHSEKEFNFRQMERNTLFQALFDGDIFVLPLRTGQLQLVENHRVRTPKNTTKNVVLGILLDGQTAERLQYWITKENLNPNQTLYKVSDMHIVNARDAQGIKQVFHVYNPDRVSQRRGVTCLAAISTMVAMHEDVQFATLVKQQMASLIAIIHNRDPNFVAEPEEMEGAGPVYENQIGGYTQTVEGIEAGLEIFAGEGEKVEAFSPNIPSNEFFQHTNLILSLIAVNLDLPVAVLMLDPSQTNFSGWRGAIDQSRIRFREIQNWYRDAFHSPIYRWKIRQWALEDDLIASVGEDAFLHRFNLPTFPYIDPVKDAQADAYQQEHLLNSPRRIQASRGRVFDDMALETVQDYTKAFEYAMAAAEELMAQYDVDVDWRELLTGPAPASSMAPVAATEPQPTPEPSSNGNGTAHNRIPGVN